MQLIHTVAELRQRLKQEAQVGFVPTMGNLHAGHVALVALAKQHASCVVVSIFVNPMQFGAGEDFASYPRTLEADCEKLAQVGADIVFAPSVQEMYPDADAQGLHQTMTITPPPLANSLCGASRSGHFAGVATVVMKLFNIVQPDVAVFGKKDFQQLMVIRALVKQFNLPIQIIAADTMRESSGLAMSSRNGYLSDAQKQQATQLYQSLEQIAQALKAGHADWGALLGDAKQTLMQAGWQVDYLEIRNALNLTPALPIDKDCVVLVAAKIGNTRLIDNLEVSLAPND